MHSTNVLELSFPAKSTLDVETVSVGPFDSAVGLSEKEVADAAAIFREHGFVILKGVLDQKGVTEVHQTCLQLAKGFSARDPTGQGNRNPGRYSIGGIPCLRLEAFAMNLLNCQPVHDVVEEIYKRGIASESGNAEFHDEPHYFVKRAGGDYCLGTTANFQKIHSDMRSASPLAPTLGDAKHGPVHSKEVPPAISVNYCTEDLHRWNGPMRIINWDQMLGFGAGKGKCAPSLDEEIKLEPDWLQSKIFPLSAGDALIRDIRVWHGGCPNLSGSARFLPALELESARKMSFDRESDERSRSKGGCKRKGQQPWKDRVATLPEVFYNRFPPRVQMLCKWVRAPSLQPATSPEQLLGRRDVALAPRDPFHLDAMSYLAAAKGDIAMLAVLDKIGCVVKRLDEFEAFIKWLRHEARGSAGPAEVTSAMKRLLCDLAQGTTEGELEGHARVVSTWAWQKLCANAPFVSLHAPTFLYDGVVAQVSAWSPLRKFETEAVTVQSEDRASGVMGRHCKNGKFGFIDLSDGSEMFVLPSSFASGCLAETGTHVRYDVVVDEKTGKERAENVDVEKQVVLTARQPWKRLRREY
eukprot:TRINITY_DN3098_c0_g2_i1.p1 TRINITY_DN3098_c0_g2~~TRINITY_DN3098_c0_g2_i1.p1  ORF type:complete len:582 (+),score=75.37 TRINITY_DN3098_c0_g2_i1:148-1893(+)